jgi:hypothetical protein
MKRPFSAGDIDKLRRWHVGPAYFLRIDWPTGTKRYCDSGGRVIADGQEWEGVSDTFGERIAFVQTIDAPALGTAPAYQFGVLAADVAFMKYILTNARLIEGTPAELFMGVFDGETGEQVIGLKTLVKGRLSSARTFWSGIGERAVSVIIEGLLQGKNYSYDGRWSSAGHRRKYPGDKGADFIGVTVSELWK